MSVYGVVLFAFPAAFLLVCAAVVVADGVERRRRERVWRVSEATCERFTREAA
jgi:cytochrome c-type biogenesis protein CcmH/NrfF